jgi:hypothetical protein
MSVATGGVYEMTDDYVTADHPISTNVTEKKVEEVIKVKDTKKWYQTDNELSNRLLGFGKEISPYVGIVFLLLIVHYLSTMTYCKYCVVTYHNYFNIVFSVSPLCSYLLDIITICHSSLNKMWYIVGGFVIMKISGIFSRINVFSNYSKKPESA